ncbi:MAG TPA: sensor histidine kinase [Rudaea sp.]|nr:sensor histidine kinase [Rudaea sp.]
MELDPQDRAQLQHKIDALLTQQRELVERLGRGQDYFLHLARSVWHVQEEERRRLARELHDGIGQNLTAIMHLVDLVLGEARGTAHERLEKARDLVVATLAETRALSRQLRPQVLDDLGLAAALDWLARTFRESHALDVRLDLAENAATLDGDAATLVFRVVQEALTNVVRHADARCVEIGLRCAAERVLLALRDDGRGCDPKHALAAGTGGRGSGLGGMRDRVRLFGGELRIESAPGSGFAIFIEFPLAQGGKERTS